MMQGKFMYLKDNGLATQIVVKHQGRGWTGAANDLLPEGDFSFKGITSDDKGKRPTFNFIVKELERGEDVEIGFSYDNFFGIPGGGHAVRVVEEGRTLGRPWLGFAHDATQSHRDPQDNKGLEVRREYVIDVDKDKFLNLGALNREVRFVLSESVRKKPPPKPDKDKFNEGKSGGSSVLYDAASETLSFLPHQMIDTGFAGDPVVGAAVNIPSFGLGNALSSGAFIFESGVDAPFTIGDSSMMFLAASLPLLTYLPGDNLFYGELQDFVLSELGSPWIAEMIDLFDPGSASFDPERKLWFT